MKEQLTVKQRLARLEARENKAKTFTLTCPTHQKIRQLREWEHDFSVSYTQRTCRITIPALREVYLRGGKGYSFAEFNAQKGLKREILRNIKEKGLEVPHYTSADITYNCYSDSLINLPVGEKITKVKELDVNKAYYQSILNLQYINKAMYKKYINLPKHIRLRFIGTIATRKRVYKYREGKIVGKPAIVENELLRRVWFHVCKEVDNALQYFKEITGKNFLMYYVDGIYLRDKDYTEEIKLVSEKFGFEFKQNEVQYITKVYNDKPRVKANQIIINKWDEDKNKFVDKPFTLKRKKDYNDDIFADILKENGYE